MKKILTLLIGALFASTIPYSQQKDSKHFIELSLGPSLPIGKFADKTYHDLYKQKPPGLAKTGWVTNVSFGYYLNRSIGLLLSAGYSNHKQDLSGYAKSLNEPASDPLLNLTFKSTNWKEMNVRAGAFFVIPLTANHRLNLVPKLTAGVCKTAVPGYDWKSYNEDGSVLAGGTVKKIDLPWGFCYQADVALKYKLGNHLHVLLNVNSFNAIPTKSFRSTYYPFADRDQCQINLNTLNAMAGIGIDF